MCGHLQNKTTPRSMGHVTWRSTIHTMTQSVRLVQSSLDTPELYDFHTVFMSALNVI